jgi:uncharacterized membrane protein YqjE
MRFLRKTIIAVCSIILLAGIKILFSKMFPHSAVFHYNLFSSLQLLLLLWAIGTGLLEYIAWKKEPPATARLKSLFSFLAFLILAEAGCSWMLYHPRSIPHPFMTAFREYYNNYQRDILQYNKNISRYDPAVFYRMKAGNRSLFANIEFADSIFTDNSGFRTNNTSGNAATSDNSPATTTTPPGPTVICLGDSYTLGWGVQQDETYPARLQSMLGQTVLNTGMSSYGTIREVESTRALDKSGVSTVIIQYCFNDADENEAFVNHHFHLSISPETVYDSAVNMLWWSNLYFPGKYFCTLTKLFLSERLHASASPGEPEVNPPGPTADHPTGQTAEAAWFLEVLRHSGLNFDSLHVFVFDIREYQNLTGKFIGALQQQLTSPDNRLFFKGNLHPLSVDGLFTPADYYLLDEHLRPSGQKKLAAYLAAAIRRSTGDSSAVNNSATFSAPALVK